MKIPLHTYLAFNSPAACMGVIEDMGFKSSARNAWGLASDLGTLINKYPEETLSRLAQIHPDKDICIYYNSHKPEGKETTATTTVSKPSQCTCGKCGGNSSQKSQLPLGISSPESLFMLFGAFLITAILISKS